MSIEKNLWLLLVFCFLTGCASEPDGAVAAGISSSLSPENGFIDFKISKQFEEARSKHKFGIVSLVAARDDGGSLECSSPPSASKIDGMLLDSSGNRWITLGAEARISYIRDRGRLEIEQNGVVIARCNVDGRHNIKLNILFDARPRPRGWSGEEMQGFEISLPETAEPRG